MSKYELVGSRNRWRLLKGVAALFTSFFLGCLLAFFVYPASEYSPILWLAAALILVPVLVLAEVVVGFGFNNRVVSKWSGSAKIMFGVFWLLFCFAVVILVLGLFSSLVVPSVA